jgi:SAM-dependent methyltransferase
MARSATALKDIELKKLADHSGSPWLADHPYFAQAEPAMEYLWNRLVWPFIADCNFETVIDLAAGLGRNSAMLAGRSTTLVIMDIQPGNVAVCRHRFRGMTNIDYLVNNGFDFRPVASNWATLIYCFDAMVHFDSDVVRSYLRDVGRVVKKGGRAFFHHSNYTDGGDWMTSPANRNFMSAAMFRHYSEKEGLTVVRQRIIDWGEYKNHDCLTMVERPLV